MSERGDGGRIIGYDLARSLAILGMIVVHFSQVMADGNTPPEWMTLLLRVLDGRAAMTFILLAGIGLTLLSRRAVQSQEPTELAGLRRMLVRRGIFLLVVGFLNLVIWPGDILRVYGVSLIVAAPLMAARSRWLVLVAFAFIAGFLLLFLIFDFNAHWNWDELSYRRLWSPEGIVRNLFYDGFRSVFPWTGMLLLGMVLGRLNLADRDVNSRVLVAATLTAVAAEVVSHFGIRFLTGRGIDRELAVSLLGTESMPALPLFLLAAGGTATAVIAFCVRVMEAYRSAAWTPLVSTGQMALTWYFGHIVIGLGIVVALELEGSQPIQRGAACGLAFFALAVVGSTLWKRYFRLGPLEALMRVVTG